MSEKYVKLVRETDIFHDFGTLCQSCKIIVSDKSTSRQFSVCNAKFARALELAALEARIDEATKCATMPYFSIIDEVTELVTKREELEKR